jgi:hypothetical protein
MKAGISIASALLCAICLNAQVATTISRLPDGSTEIRVQNNAPVELVALAIVAKIHGSSHAPFEAYDDSATRLGPNRETTYQILLTPLAPNKEVKVQVVMLCGTDRDVIAVPPRADKKTRALCELEQPITAAIFADGSTAGEASLLTRMALRRSNMLLAVDTTLDTLSDAGHRNLPRQQLIEEFKKMADALNRWYVVPEQRVGRDLYESIAGKLMNLAEVAAGMPFPPDSFVEQETRVLREQRAVLLQSQASLAETGLFAR